MLETICKKCGKKFRTYLCRKIKGHDKYCSKECTKTSIVKKCLICRKPFKAFQRSLKVGYGKYCSRSCASKDHIHSEKTKGKISKIHKGRKHSLNHRKKNSLTKLRNKNPNWRGGKFKSLQGYILILLPEHPFATISNRVMEHRLIMEKHLGRYLRPEERVHHLNGVRDDNRIENLKLFANHSEHLSFHYPKGKKIA